MKKFEVNDSILRIDIQDNLLAIGSSEANQR